MKYIDLSHKLNKDTQVYPGDPKFVIEKLSKADDDYFLSNINGSPHTGTHIDAPYHYIKNGKKVGDLDINTLIGKATILKTKREIFNDSINIKDIDIKNPIEKIVILKTEWYKHWGNDYYFTKNPYISNELADMLIENKVKGVAIDTCSVDKIGEAKIHKLFLKNDIWIVENLTNLNKLSKNNYYSYFIPMNIDAEASYIRAFVKDK